MKTAYVILNGIDSGRDEQIYSELIEPTCKELGFSLRRASPSTLEDDMEPIVSDMFSDSLVIADCGLKPWNATEVYFRTLKTGCRVEDMRLERNARLKNALAFYEIIAWRILYLMHLNRTDPDIPCDEVFVEHEWKSVRFVTKKTPPPLKPPTLAEFLRLLTLLGGYTTAPPNAPQVRSLSGLGSAECTTSRSLSRFLKICLKDNYKQQVRRPAHSVTKLFSGHQLVQRGNTCRRLGLPTD